MSFTMSIPVEAPALNCKPGPFQVAALPAVEHKRPFYFEDSQVVLQVDGQMYKIHRYFLTRESQFFSDLFSLPQPGDSASVEGSDNNPIKVPETPTIEFENLLRFFYFGMHDDYVASLADWISMLSISTRLLFEKVRNRAIKEITTRMNQVDPFELIGLAIKYDVEQWLKPAYRRIATRNELITHKEALEIPFHMAVMLMRSRERYWKDSDRNHYYYSDSMSADGTSWPRGHPDPTLDPEIKIMDMASVEKKTGPNTGLSQAG